MRPEKFEIKRADGRSNSQVICDFVSQHDKPGIVFSYKDLGTALSVGVDRIFKRNEVQAAVRNSGPMLGRLHKRALNNVRNTGYRLALAEEHRDLAYLRHDKANRQLKRGYEILRDTRLDEIKDEQSRRAHEGQLLAISTLLHISAAHEKRINRIEGLINRMIGSG